MKDGIANINLEKNLEYLWVFLKNFTFLYKRKYLMKLKLSNKLFSNAQK